MPDRTVLCNTSPLLYLNLVGHLELLSQLYGTITIPEAVQVELEVGRRKGIDVPAVETISWIHTASLQDRTLLPLVTDLGAGEAELIGLGKADPESLLILDDALGRRIARISELQFTGTLGVIVKAKNEGLIQHVKPAVLALREAGLWVSNELASAVLKQANE